MKTFKQFLSEMKKELPKYKMKMRNVDRIISAQQRYKENPSEENLNNLKKANSTAIDVLKIINRHFP
jgi:hypothetical protein